MLRYFLCIILGIMLYIMLYIIWNRSNGFSVSNQILMDQNIFDIVRQKPHSQICDNQRCIDIFKETEGTGYIGSCDPCTILRFLYMLNIRVDMGVFLASRLQEHTIYSTIEYLNEHVIPIITSDENIKFSYFQRGVQIEGPDANERFVRDMAIGPLVNTVSTDDTTDTRIIFIKSFFRNLQGKLLPGSVVLLYMEFVLANREPAGHIAIFYKGCDGSYNYIEGKVTHKNIVLITSTDINQFVNDFINHACRGSDLALNSFFVISIFKDVPEGFELTMENFQDYIVYINLHGVPESIYNNPEIECSAPLIPIPGAAEFEGTTQGLEERLFNPREFSIVDNARESLQQLPCNKYLVEPQNEKDWVDLTGESQKLLIDLGWTRVTWDDGDPSPLDSVVSPIKLDQLRDHGFSDDWILDFHNIDIPQNEKDWVDLTHESRTLLESLGWTQVTWDGSDESPYDMEVTLPFLDLLREQGFSDDWILSFENIEIPENEKKWGHLTGESQRLLVTIGWTQVTWDDNDRSPFDNAVSPITLNLLRGMDFSNEWILDFHNISSSPAEGVPPHRTVGVGGSCEVNGCDTGLICQMNDSNDLICQYP